MIGESDSAYVSRCKNKLDGLDYAVKVQKKDEPTNSAGTVLSGVMKQVMPISFAEYTKCTH